MNKNDGFEERRVTAQNPNDKFVSNTLGRASHKNLIQPTHVSVVQT